MAYCAEHAHARWLSRCNKLPRHHGKCARHADRELEEILLGSHSKARAQPVQKQPQLTGIVRRPVAADDLCPICYEDLQGTALKHLTWCKAGCGQNVHGKCMQEWVLHQKRMEKVRNHPDHPKRLLNVAFQVGTGESAYKSSDAGITMKVLTLSHNW